MIYEQLIAYQKNLIKIDTHEHLPPEQYVKDSNTDIFDILLVPYNCDTIKSAGCDEAVYQSIMDKTQPFAKRYQLLLPFLSYIQYTTLFQATKESLQKNFAIDDLSMDSLWKANQILQSEQKEKHYQKYMAKDKIEKILVCSQYDFMEAFTDVNILGIPTVSEILPRNQADIHRLSHITQGIIFDFHSFLDAISLLFEQYKKLNIRAVKFGSAYRRDLHFKAPDFKEANLQFQRILDTSLMGDAKANQSSIVCADYQDVLALDDYITHYLLSLCMKHQMDVVFHTGLHAWNENDPDRAHAAPLVYLIRKYPQVRFVLLHAGVPFVEECILLTRYYQNVYLDLTWLHILSPQLSKITIERIIELVPINKIFGFGGDYCYIQSITGHLHTAMKNFALVFSEKINQKEMSLEDAKYILKLWYYENPKLFYRL